MKLYRNIIILVVLIAILGAGYFFISKYEPAKEDTGIDTSYTSVSVFKTDKENIKSVEIINENESYTVSKGENGKWIINGNPNIKVSQSKVDTLMYDASSISAKEKAAENATDLSQYGLDLPKRKAIIKTNNGETVTFSAGDKTADGSYYFVMIEGESDVYIKGASSVESLTKSVAALRDLSLYSVSEEKIEKFVLKKKDNEEIVMERENKGTEEEPSYAWKMLKPISAEANDYTLSEEVLGKIISLTAESIVDDKTFEACGLNTPYAKFSVFADGESHTVTIGNANGDMYYASVSGSDAIYSVKSENVSFVELPYTSLINKLILLENINDVNGVEISGMGKSYTLKHTGSDENDTYKINDKEISEKTYKNAYQAVLSVSLESVANGSASGSIDACISYDRKDGTASKLEFISYDDRNYIVKKNGEGNYLIKKKQLEAIFEKLENVYNS